ncbi:uncharacterized protein [Oscarella lobularis]|uniref:uncharacterized protein n=1 Tax=Oscarella lobularis TaxID=121494 RepID=UPI003313B3D2
MTMKLFVYFSLGIVLAAHTSLALNCYSCHSPSEEECSSGEINSKYSKTCPNGANSFCAVTNTVGKSDDLTISFEVRFCAATCANGSVTVGRITTETKCCTTNNCNGDFDSVVSTTGSQNVNKDFQCYTCVSSSSLSSCTDKVTCSVTDNTKLACATTKSTLDSSSYSSGCATQAVCDAAVASKSFGSFTKTSCCDTSLCKSDSAAAAAKSGFFATFFAGLVALVSNS